MSTYYAGLLADVGILLLGALSVYITLATEHDEHEADAKSHGAGAAHAAGAGA